MEKKILIIFPFFLGLVFLVYSWFLSYPLSVNSVTDSIFNHISIFYWLGFSILFTSMFSMAILFKNKYLKWVLSVGCILLLYSLSFYYYALPGSDAQYFRGLSQYFINTHELIAGPLNHNYYQWPFFFILADIATSISGINLTTYTFLLFAIIGSLLSTALYVIALRVNKQLGFLAVASFFIVLFYFLNYQAVPFSLAFGLLLLLFMLEVLQKPKSTSATIVVIVLFTSISFTHAFVPLFFILYLFVRTIISKSKWHFGMLLLTSIIFFLVQITFGRISFAFNLSLVLGASSEFGSIASSTLVSSAPVEIDVLAQTLSRILTIGFAVICIVGFLFLLIKRKLKVVDIAVFLTGVVYSGLGVVLYVLGSRALALVFLPVSLGIMYLAASKFGRYLKGLILIFLILVVFIPIHNSFNVFPVNFQTKEDITTANFALDKYNWNSAGSVISDNGAKWYIYTLLKDNTNIDTGLSSQLGLSKILSYDCIIYSVGLAKNLQTNKNSSEEISQQIRSSLNIVYDSGFSYVAVKSR